MVPTPPKLNSSNVGEPTKKYHFLKRQIFRKFAIIAQISLNGGWVEFQNIQLKILNIK